jgi:hypothetical protein
MDIHCPTCGKSITVSEQHYNQEVSCPFCDQSLFLEDQAESPSDEIVSTVSEEWQPVTETEVQQGNQNHEPMGNKVASVLAKIIGGVFMGFAAIYTFEALMMLVIGLPSHITSGLDELPNPKAAKQGAYFGIIFRPLVLGFLGWLFFFLARKKILSKGTVIDSRSLYYASSEGRKEVAEMLIAKGVDVNGITFNKTPLDAAKYEDRFLLPQNAIAKEEIVILLRKHGGKTKKELEAEGK